MKDDRLYLIHVLECVDRIYQFTAGGKNEFLNSSLIQDAVTRNLQIMAEPLTRISTSLKRDHTEIDWKGVSGFRNILVHDYIGIDIAKVWDIVEKELPAFKKAVRSMLDKLK